MGANVQAIFEGDEIGPFLDKLQDRFGDLNKGSKALGGIISSKVFGNIIKHFESETGPQGKWKEWSRAYADHMNKIGKGGNMILQDTGRLRQSITPAQGMQKIIAGGIMFYSPVVYSGIHDQGSKERNMPQRQFMWLDDDALETIGDLALKWVVDEA